MKTIKKKTKVIRNESYKKASKKKIVNKEINKSRTPVRKKIQWNYSRNDLVMLKCSDEIGIIISDSTYLTHKVESNYFFVLTGNYVKRVEGGTIKPFVNSKH
jgi:hypothetical protein